MRYLLLATLLLPTPLRAQDIEIMVPKDLQLTDFVKMAGAGYGGAILFVEADLKDRMVAGSFKMTIPRARFGDAFRFILGMQDIRVRDFGGIENLAVVLPKTATTNEFMAVGLDRTVKFNRPPAAWLRESDAEATLTADSTKALIATVRDAEAGSVARGVAAKLLGFCAPRKEHVVQGLAAALDTKDKLIIAAVSQALGRIGYAARPALPALKKVDHPDARAALETIQSAISPAMLNPRLARDKAPDTFRVKFETTKGDIVLEVTRAWSPRGVDRFFNLVKIGYFTEIAFFRMVPSFVAQFGIHGDPRVSGAWRNANIGDDPVKQSNKMGTVSFANAGRNTRSVQFFINTADNNRLDTMGFSPFGRVVEGMDVVKKLNAEYGEAPNQQRMQFEGNEYLKKFFERLDYIKRAKIVK